MDLKFYIEEFINDNLSIEEIVKITNFSFTSFIRNIKRYYKMKNEDIPKNIKDKINNIYLDMYKKRKEGLSYEKIGRKYNIDGISVKRYIIEYCQKNNVPFLDGMSIKKQNYENIEEKYLEELYNYKLSGLSYEKIAQMYNFSVTKIRMMIINYCKNNNLDIPYADSYKPQTKELSLTAKEIYKLRLDNKSYYSIAIKCNCSADKIRRVLVSYCKENNLDVPHVNNRRKKVIIPMDEIYSLKDKGMSYNELALKYNCSAYTISSKFDIYLKKRLLLDLCLIKEDKLYKDDEDFKKSLV